MNSDNSSGYRLFVWLAMVAGGLALAWVTGRLDPILVPDSPSYLNYPFETLDAACRSIRTPAYPIWLWLVTRVGGIGLVPACQVIAHATAVFVLVVELKRWGMPRLPLVAVAIAVGVGCTPMDHLSTVSTDALAASCGIVTAAFLLRWARCEGTRSASVAVMIAAATTILIRPAYLFLIPWLFVAGWMLRRLKHAQPREAIVSSVLLATLTLLPILGWMTLRWAAVGEFSMLPFGHQNLAGVLVQLVSDDELATIDGDAADLAQQIIKEKIRLSEMGHVFADGDPRATMTIDARWDDMTYFVVIPAAQQVVGDDRVARHRKIAQLNKEIVRRWPQRYGLWLIKGFRRGAWAIAADIVMHPVFLATILLTIGIVLFRSIFGSTETVVTMPHPSMAALAIITLTYMVMKVGFVVLTSPPIGRFSDAAAIFLPAWLAAILVTWLYPETPEKS